MASISSLSGSSSATSIYGNRNVISGLASGLDTETLIENAVSGFKNKITALQQQQELVQWKQDAYRSIIDKMVQLNRKYTSYTSSTNLFSPSFFNKAVTTSALGKNADKVSASGRTNSDVKILGVSKLAQAAQYKSSVGGADSLLAGLTGTVSGDVLTATAAGKVSLTDEVELGSLKGGMTIKYGASSVYVGFDENDTYKTAEDLVKGIREKLGDSMVKTGSGEYVKASDRIDVKYENGSITFSDKSSAKNAVYISSVDKDLGDKLNIKKTGDTVKGFEIKAEPNLIEKKGIGEYLEDKSLSVTLNGSTKTISLKGITDSIKAKLGDKTGEDDKKEAIRSAIEEKINEGLKKSFGGTDKNQNVKASISADGKLSFTAKKGDTLSVTSSADKVLGLGENGLTSYLNTNAKLGDILKGKKISIGEGDQKKDVEFFHALSEKEIMDMEQAKNDKFSADDFAKKYTETKVKGADGQEHSVFIDKDGKEMYSTHTLNVNGQEFTIDRDTTMESLMSKVNGNKEAGVNISYSKLTNQFSITATETGTSGRIDVSGELAGIFGVTEPGEGGVPKLKLKDAVDENGQKVADGNFTRGTDAELEVEINGATMNLTRSSNTIDFDGMSVTLKGTFAPGDEGYEPITFESKADTDKIVDAIKSFVDDYNELVTEVRKQYATMPAEKSTKNHTRYMPLTDKDKEDMSESAIKAYEEKAKQGILFGQSDLAGLHSALRDAISFTSGKSDSRDALTLSKMGISTSYANGLTTLDLDVEKLRETLESDPDSVRDMFTKSTENGASSSGLMQNLKGVIDKYANTSTGSQGILIQRAGSQYAPTSVNSNALQQEYENLSTQISKWQDKMTDRVDYYTRQFTALEQLMSQMNNQSSMLAGLMGGGGY